MGRVPTKDVMRFMADCLKAVGANQKPADQMAELLLQADRMGHASHGLNRLEHYLEDIKAGICKPNNKPKVLKHSVSTALVDAMNVLGATSAHYCMDLAMLMAKKSGVGWVTVRGANHYGMAGWWGLKAAKKGYIGLTFTNTSPYMAPTRSKKVALGTNPISVVAQGSEGEYFYLEMATTAVAVGNIEMLRRKGEPLPYGWAQGPDGKETRNPEIALKTRCLMPLGGGEENSGYKGYNLAAIVELFCGISSGSSYGHKVRSWGTKTKLPANLGQCFAAVDPKCFAPGFGERLTDCIRYWRRLEPTDPTRPVLAPGDIEFMKMKEFDKLGMVPYVRQQLVASAVLARKLKVKPLAVKLDRTIS